MSTQEYDRWYIVPAEEHTTSAETHTIPKYSDNTGINGHAGATVDRDALGNYAGLLATYPDIDTWYIVRLYGTWDALNSISTLGDTRNLATNYQDVAAVLDQRFPDLEKDPEQWADAFWVGSPN